MFHEVLAEDENNHRLPKSLKPRSLNYGRLHEPLKAAKVKLFADCLSPRIPLSLNLMTESKSVTNKNFRLMTNTFV